MNPDYLVVDGVSKHYRTARGDVIEAIQSFTLRVGQGEFVSLVGPSGCGKSTLLKIIAGVIPSDSGQISVGGRPVGSSGPRGESVKIGMVFQKPSLFPWKTLLDNVLAPIRLMGQPTGPYEARARELLAMVGLGGFEHRYPHELSGGMQQRASICRALIHDPDVLLMDEPFAALDAMTRDQLNLQLASIWQTSRKTILFVTHNIQEAVFLADRVVVLGPRPSVILEEVKIDLPRPRTIPMRTEQRFGELTLRIYRHFGISG